MTFNNTYISCIHVSLKNAQWLKSRCAKNVFQIF